MSSLYIYTLISVAVTILILIVAGLRLQTQRARDRLLRFFAISTVIVHYSSLWVDFFTTGQALAGANMLLPIYPCNIVMWMLVIVAFQKDRTNPILTMLTEFVFLAGSFCAIIGIVLNENYFATPTLTDYTVFKGLLSHSTMLAGCLYLAVGKYVRIRVANTASVAAGLSLFLVIGFCMNALFDAFGLETPNAMYLREVPFPDYPWLTSFVMGLAGCTVIFLFTLIYELCTLPKQERTLYHLKCAIEQRTNKKVR